MNDLTVKVKRMHEDAVIPHYAYDGDAGADLYTLEDTIIKANQTIVVATGIALELPPNSEAQIRPRSGISLNGCEGCYVIDVKKPILMCGKFKKSYFDECSPYLRVQFGTVDSKYRKAIGIITYNQESYDVLIPKGTRLAQMVIKKTYNVNIKEVHELSETSRGDGFGSSGIK